MEIVFKVILFLVSISCIFCVFQKIIKTILNDKILNDIGEIDPEGASLVKNRYQKLGYITLAAAIIEYLFFAMLALYFLRDNKLADIEIGNFFKFLTGWLAIKTIPNYKMWSHLIVGKAYFYRSLFGTILSISAGLLLGFVTFIIFIKL